MHDHTISFNSRQCIRILLLSYSLELNLGDFCLLRNPLEAVHTFSPRISVMPKENTIMYLSSPNLLRHRPIDYVSQVNELYL